MLDKEDLQAIAQLMAQHEQRLTSVMESREQRLEQRLISVMESREQRLEQRLTSMVKDTEQRLVSMIENTEQKLTSMVKDTEQHTLVMMESYFGPRFEALSEKLDLLEEKMVPSERVDDAEDRLDVLEATVKQNSRDIAKLKKAQ